MAVRPEIVGEILSFYPDNKQTVIAQIDADTSLVCGVFSYQNRATWRKGEPLMLSWTRQRVVALVGKGRVTPLVHASDVEAIDELTAEKVADHIRFIQNPVPHINGVNQEEY